MPNDIPPPIKYTSRVRRGFGYILNEKATHTAQDRKDADLSVAWMKQEYDEQMRRDSAPTVEDPLPCPSTPSTPPAESSNPAPGS